MDKTTQQRNKDIVLEAFDTLFNKRDYAKARRSGLRSTFSTARTSSRAAKDYSIWSKASPPR
jgi:hypothetical protein